MQRTDMRTMIRDLLQLDNTTELPNSTIDIYLDEGHAEVVTRMDWEFLSVASPVTVNTVAGTESYAAAAVDRVVSVIETTNDRPLQNISRVDYLHLLANDTARNNPTHYNFWDGRIYLWPTPGSVVDVDIYYQAHPTFGSGDTAEPDWEANFHYILVDWALHRLWEREEDFDRSDMYRSRFEAKMVRLEKFYNTHVQMRPAAYGGGISAGHATNVPWLTDAANGGATG